MNNPNIPLGNKFTALAIITLVLVILAIGWWSLHSPQQPSEKQAQNVGAQLPTATNQPTDSNTAVETQPTASPTANETRQDLADKAPGNTKAQSAGNGTSPKPATGAAATVDRYERSVVLAERESLLEVGGERRITRLRLVRENTFKYPLIRVEDEFRDGPQGRVLLRQTAMVGDHVMVKPKDAKMDEKAMLASLKKLGATVRRKMPASGVWLVAFPNANLETVTNAIAEMGKLKELVRYAEPDYIVHATVIPGDTSFGDLWGMHNTGQSGGTVDADIDAPEAWDLNTGSATVKVGVIDTGIDHAHPDLAANIWTNPAEIAGNGIDDDGNGYIDDTRGWDFVNNDNNATDDHYHGTHCAGTIGGVGNNGAGVTGVCWSVSLIPLKFLDATGSGSGSDALEAVAYGTGVGVHLTSNSWGGGGYSQAFKDVLDAANTAGILFVAAAGNDASNNDAVASYPSNYDSPNVISVAATTRTDAMSSFSNYGLTMVDLGAPGSSIYSTQPGGLYQNLSGTSMATPHVAGACALLKAFRPSLSHAEIRNTIIATVDPTPAMAGKSVSGGRLNIRNALLGLDDLSVTPGSALAATGPLGGPFAPSFQTYTLTNHDATTALSWTATAGANWFSVSPSGGTLAAGASTTVTVAFNGAAASLAAGSYSSSVIFTNTASSYELQRVVNLNAGSADYFTELFTSANDTDNQSWLFTPNASANFYSVLRTAAVAFPTSPTGGTTLVLSEDSFLQVTPTGGATVSLYGTSYSSLYVSSNGYVTFGTGDTDYEESLAAHFAMPRIAVLFDDLDPSAGGTISWRQLADRVAVTYQNVPQWGTANSNNFQIEMFLDGRIRITCLGIAAADGLIGLSKGLGTPATFVSSDFSAYGAVPQPTLAVTVPSTATEGDGVLAGLGTVTLSAVQASDTVVALASSSTGEATVPATATILAGQLSATFDVTILDDAFLDGTQTVIITASSAGFGSGAGVIAVQDNDGTATLSLSVPASAAENAGTVQGTVTASTAPGSPVTVSLSSSDTSEAQVPPTVVIPAGQTSANFTITIVNDTAIDGTQAATITAHVANWTDGNATINVLDNENTNLGISLPSPITEGATGTGTVTISGTLPSPLVVSLSSDTTSRLTVPATATIAAGATSATFTLTAVNNALTDGTAGVLITASASGFTGASATTSVLDDDVHHFTISTIASPQTRGVPFNATITAQDVNNVTVASFTGTAALSASGTGGAVSITPTTTTAFTAGVWTGSVTVNNFDTGVVLTASDGAGHTGASNAFDVGFGALHHFTWNTQASRAQGAAVSATVTAQDAGNNTVTSFGGTANLSGYINNPGGPGIVITEINTNTPDEIEFTNVSAAPVNISGWSIYIYDNDTGGFAPKIFTVPAATTCAAGQVFRLQESGTSPGAFPFFNYGANINWTTTDFDNVAVLIRDAANNNVDFVCAAALTSSGVTSPGTIPSSQWTGAQVSAPTNSTHSYVRTGNADSNNATNWTSSTPGLGTLNSGLSVPFAASLSAVTVSPTITGTFSSGVWTGDMTVLQTATQMKFRVNDGSGHIGDSNAFDVLLSPTVTTVAASAFTETGATLNGIVNAQGNSTSVIFEYGTDTSYGTTVAGTPSPVTGSSNTNVSATISGLLASTTYHFRAKGTNAATTISGGDLTFKTLPWTPQDWRLHWYGTTENTGNAADSADPYMTGVSNLLAYAHLGPNQNPALATADQISKQQIIGDDFVLSVTRPAGVTGVTYGAEWRPSLTAGSWQPVADTGSGDVHTFSVPIGENKKLFMRFTVTSP